MIPSNIWRTHVIRAIRDIDSSGVPPGRLWRKFILKYGGKDYPPKYALSLANKFANGVELDPESFSGGQETNTFLNRLGFHISGTETPRTRSRGTSVSRQTPRSRTRAHTERCPECKTTIKRLLERIYGVVHSNYKFDLSANLDGYADSYIHPHLQAIHSKLQNHRGHKTFVRTPLLPHCDFFIPKPGFILEFDESQHFTAPRRLSLEAYPCDLKLGFSKDRWIALCEQIAAKDNDPPHRDEQRAWYDTLRDFLPSLLSLRPTVSQPSSKNNAEAKHRGKMLELGDTGGSYIPLTQCV